MYKYKITLYSGGDIVSFRIEADDYEAACNFAERIGDKVGATSTQVEEYE